jgi:hypothetical protein
MANVANNSHSRTKHFTFRNVPKSNVKWAERENYFPKFALGMLICNWLICLCRISFICKLHIFLSLIVLYYENKIKIYWKFTFEKQLQALIFEEVSLLLHIIRIRSGSHINLIFSQLSQIVIQCAYWVKSSQSAIHWQESHICQLWWSYQSLEV